VLEHLKELKASLENREELEAKISRLEEAGAAAATDLVSSARGLSERRKATASRFEKMIEAELKSLGMEGGAFKVVFEAIEEGETVEAAGGESAIVSETGSDGVEFFLRTNKGEDLMPLRRIASGGEVSRVMLALKRVLAEVDRVGTLVFDEIDSGIGGTIADVVAAKLRQVSRSRQVICITHLAQIAAASDLHLAVDKSEAKGRTVTRIDAVRGEEQVKEIVRMLAGAKAPKAAWVHAQEMLKRKAAR
jgi:DNA repair protein RecN (Recombination protein N)